MPSGGETFPPFPEGGRKRTVKLALVFGTRPEAIKMAPVILEARRRASVEPLIVSTGQHREMLRPILALFGIHPHRDLDLMVPNQTLAGLTARATESLSNLFREERPDAVVVQGDTTTAMCAAIAAFYERIPVAHVEAGLRSDRLDAPFPEEFNRRTIGQVARWHLAPTPTAAGYLYRDNLQALGGGVHVTGNTVIDALYLAVEAIAANPPQSETLDRVRRQVEGGGRMVLVTGHRRENFGEPFREFCHGLADIAIAHPETLLVYPVHLNPNVQAPVREILGGLDNVLLCAPADYPEFVALMQAATLIITDSGGVQEEAPALGKPVLVTRDVTERPEAVAAGGVRLVGPRREAIVREALELLRGGDVYTRMAKARQPYGDGKAAARCLDAIEGKDFKEFAPER